MIALLVISNTVFAQKQLTIPAPVKSAFEKQFATAVNPKWEKEDGKYEVSFTNNGKETSALFSPQGMLEETEVMIPETELPPSALKIAKAKGTIREATRITKADGSTWYEAEVKGKDLLFDSNGNPVKH